MKPDNALIESEQTVLGSLLLNNDCFDRIEGLKAEAFYREDHRIIFKAIVSFVEQNKPVDIILLAEQLQRQGDLERVGNLAYIGALVQSVASTRNVKAHALKVINQWKLRRLKTLLAELGDDVDSRLPVDEILAKAESEMFGLLEGNEESELVTIKQAVIEAVDWEDSDHKGVQTGLRDLDRLTGGFCKSNMIVIAGRPSMGKSALAVQIAEHVSHAGHVIIFSLEMSAREIGSRFLTHHKHVTGISQAIGHSGDLKLVIDGKAGATLQHIRSQCRKAKRKNGLDMIVIDYLQLMQGTGDNRTQEIGAISRGLKGIAKEFDIPVVVLSQLSRKVEERSDKRPLMSDLRDSGEIEQDADLILLIYREEAYDKETENKDLAEIIVRKNRNGATGEIYATFTGSTTRFSDFNGQRILRSVKHSRAYD
jgi:replicative DNA helicase